MLHIDITRLVHQLSTVMLDSSTTQTFSKEERLTNLSILIGAYCGNHFKLFPGISAISVYNNNVFSHIVEFLDKVNSAYPISVEEALSAAKLTYCSRWNLVYSEKIDLYKLMSFIRESSFSVDTFTDKDHEVVNIVNGIIFNCEERDKILNLLGTLKTKLDDAFGE